MTEQIPDEVIAEARRQALTEAREVVRDAAPGLNAELRYNGTEDPETAAYVSEFRDAACAIDALLAETEEERQIGCAEEPSGTDVEDAEWWRARIRAALVAALGEEQERG